MKWKKPQSSEGRTHPPRVRKEFAVPLPIKAKVEVSHMPLAERPSGPVQHFLDSKELLLGVPQIVVLAPCHVVRVTPVRYVGFALIVLQYRWYR